MRFLRWVWDEVIQQKSYKAALMDRGIQLRFPW